MSESTCTRELSALDDVSCSKLSTCVIVVPSDEMVNVLMMPSPQTSVYANATVSESTLTRELFQPLLVSCSKLFPSDCVLTAVMLPSLSIVNVEMKPSSSAPVYANANVSESTLTRELAPFLFIG